MEKIRYASKSSHQVSEAWFESHPYNPVKHKAMLWPSITPRHVKRSVILIRFRKFIEGEKLSADLIAAFLASCPHWWLLSADPWERDHARTVLERLWMLYDMNRED